MKYLIAISLFSIALPAHAERTKIESLPDAIAQLKVDLSQKNTHALNWLNGRNTKVIDAKDHPNELLKDYLDTEPKGFRNAVRKAFIRWARPSDADALVNMIPDELAGPFHGFGMPSLTALFRVDPSRGREYLAEHIIKKTKNFDGSGVRSVIKLGGAVEKDVLPLLSHKNDLVQAAGVKILSDIGTSKSIPALRKLATATKLKRLKRSIDKAVEKIGKRGD